ncbi:hypothetical protein F503_05780 [Ophiostoma piceae UAMH 11346]|uniref:Uncharacterized protein n=1 Tax=Ophiostoma piceae (strain UAMH 11346) TaxID=1262450 RepID=S3DAW0_OPHP1|nr:hypothetical protein F503_05780 [Ophiostoma piceae UAMH 11346]
MPVLPHTRFCRSPEPMMDEESMLPAAVGPVYPHQRGRRRSPAPVPPPHALYDPSAMRISLAMTPAHPTSNSASASRRVPRSSQRARQPRPRQQTPSGGNGTFRGRRRYRSPSLSMTSAIRKASTRPHTPSPAMSRSSSLLKSKSRPSSPLSPGAGSIHARGESSSPRRMIFRATVDMDHGVYPYFHQHHQHHHHYHLQQLHSHLQHLHPASGKTHKPRRAHCPSRAGSVDGSETRRRRQRTRSRPRYTGDTVSEMYELSVAAALAQSSMAGSSSPRSDAANASSHTRSDVSMLVADANGASSDGNATVMGH